MLFRFSDNLRINVLVSLAKNCAGKAILPQEEDQRVQEDSVKKD